MHQIRDEGKFDIPDNYEQEYKKAFLTFKFQRVYCPKRQKIVMLNEITDCPHGSELAKFKDTSFLGK